MNTTIVCISRCHEDVEALRKHIRMNFEDASINRIEIVYRHQSFLGKFFNRYICQCTFYSNHSLSRAKGNGRELLEALQMALETWQSANI